MFTRCQPRCIRLARTRGSMSHLWSRIAFKRSGNRIPALAAKCRLRRHHGSRSLVNQISSGGSNRRRGAAPVARRRRVFRLFVALACFLRSKARRSTFLSADLYAVELLEVKWSRGIFQLQVMMGRLSDIFNFNEFSRTLIVAAQMFGDGLILTTLSYVSFSFSIYLRYAPEYLESLPYLFFDRWYNCNHDFWFCAL